MFLHTLAAPARAAAAALALSALCPAQVGMEMIEPPLREFGNTAAAEYQDYLGRAVLLVFVQPGEQTSDQLVSHLNVLVDTYGSRGLSVVAVTPEDDEAELRTWIEVRQAKFGFALMRGEELQRFALIASYPHALLVDPAGTVGWSGYGGQVTADVIAPHITGALPRPMFDWPRDADKVAQEIRKGRLAQALEAATAVRSENGDLGTELVESVKGLVTFRVERLRAARASGDYARVLNEGDDTVRMLEGLPQAADVEALVEEVEGDDAAVEIAGAQRDVARLRGRFDKLKKKRDADSLVSKFERLAADNVDNHAGEDAKRALDELKRLRIGLQ
ncbi:peroxiredoxin family protein [Engelhardtia mirabilis]|uniref:AhpC/TSA family protein n=1 Tax=Engelhardtia mirabilis TaxID=2528011 RepID=A0A518BJ22_9BACT|nr:hypothetical protein Pla133_20400 [Planctomycetes bacterium Pla133]QDV01292.1 hypothetical protein Pla86_20410 [Planctomycetes bacterium Pla86]